MLDNRKWRIAMLKKMLLATVAVIALATGAQADTVVRVGTVGPWGISLNKDKQTCNAFTQFNDTVLAIGHRENAGIWHAALFMPWANWFDDNQTVDVKVTFDFGRRQYTTVATVEDKKDPHGKRLSFRMSGDMLIDFASSSSMQVKATVNGHDQSTPYMDLKGTRNLIEKIEDCQDTAGGTPAAANFVQKEVTAPTGQIGCERSMIRSVGSRLEGVKDWSMGVGVSYSNGAYSVSYGGDPAVGPVSRSRPGDIVLMCLVSPPRASDGGPCPKGDNRGSVYRVQNLRTRESWTLPDSAHMCGGA
jgi:hypothetical protein